MNLWKHNQRTNKEALSNQASNMANTNLIKSKQTNTIKTGIKIIQWNKGSSKLYKRIPNIDTILLDHSPQILIINEANVNNEELKHIHFNSYNIETDNLIRDNIQARTIMLIHTDIAYERCKSLEKEGLSTIWIKAGYRQQKKILINGHYRQWRRTDDKNGSSHHLSEQRIRLKNLLEPWTNLATSNLELIVMGDINLPDADDEDLSLYEKKLSPLIEEYKTALLNSSLTKIKTTFTRQQAGSKDTSPDQVHVTHPSKISKPEVQDKGDSDHGLVIITRQTNKPTLRPRYRKSRSYKSLDIDEFKCQILQDHRYLAAIIETDTNLVTNHLQSLITDKLNDAAPETTIQLSKKTDHKISIETRDTIKRRDKARKTARITGDQDDWREYRNIRNEVTKRLHKEYRDQDEKHLNPKNNSPAQLWMNAKILSGTAQKSTPRRLLHRGEHFDKPEVMANILNEEYIRRAEEILNEIPKSDTDPMINYNKMLNGRQLKMSLKTISMADLKKVMRSMRPTKSTAEDGISMKLVKQAQQVLFKPLLNLVNTSITTNTFPEDLKTAKIIPILKQSKDPSLPKSWRPVNILPSLSKILEKVIVNQLKKHLINNAIITGNHTGSRPKNSTTTAALTLHDIWSSVLDDDLEAVVIQLDQSAAYDIVSHEILQNKLKALGLDKDAMNWFISYMNNRRQRVHVEASQSEERQVGRRSVIQGSTLSCLLYLIYILDMPEIFHNKPHTPYQDVKCPRPTTFTYVDDFNTTITTKKNDPDLMTRKLHENLSMTQQYMDANRLALNSEKTKIFLISKHPDRSKQVKLTVNNKVITHNKTINVLGICINEKLTWNSHLINGEKSLAQQIRQRLVVLRRLVRLTSRSFAKTLTTSLIKSKIEYAAALWGSAPNNLLDIIQKLLNKAARIALGPGTSRWPITKLMTEMGWLCVKDMIKYHQCCLIHQVVYTGSPEYIREKLLPEKTGNTRSFAHNKLGPKPITAGNSMYTKNIFMTTAYSTYNSLPSILTAIPIRSMFKIRLKRYIINKEDIPCNLDKIYGKFLLNVTKRSLDKCRPVYDNTPCD